MFSVLYKRYAFAFFLLWGIAVALLVLFFVWPATAGQSLCLLLAAVAIALGIGVKVLDALHFQRVLVSLLRQGQPVEEAALAQMGSLALRRPLKIRRLQLMALAAFANQQPAAALAAIKEAWSLARKRSPRASKQQSGQLCAQLLLLEAVSEEPFTQEALLYHDSCTPGDARLISLCADIQDFERTPSLAALYAMDALVEQIEEVYVRQYATLILARLRYPLQPMRAFTDIERLARVAQLADVRSRANAYRIKWKEGKRDAGSTDVEEHTVEDRAHRTGGI